MLQLQLYFLYSKDESVLMSQNKPAVSIIFAAGFEVTVHYHNKVMKIKPTLWWQPVSQLMCL